MEELLEPPRLWNLLVKFHVKRVPQRHRVASHVEVIKQLVCKAGFPDGAVVCITADARRYTACVPGKVAKVLPLVSWNEDFFMQGQYTADNSVLSIFFFF